MVKDTNGLLAGTFDIVLDTLEDNTSLQKIKSVRHNNALGVLRQGDEIFFTVPSFNPASAGRISIYNHKGILVDVIPVMGKSTAWNFKTADKLRSGKYVALLNYGTVYIQKRFQLM